MAQRNAHSGWSANPLVDAHTRGAARRARRPAGARPRAGRANALEPAGEHAGEHGESAAAGGGCAPAPSAADLELDALRSLFEAVNREREELEARLCTTEQELAEKSAQLETLQARADVLKAQLVKTEAALDEARSLADAETQRAAAAAATGTALRERLAQRRAEAVDKALAANHWENECSKVEAKVAQLEAQLDSNLLYRRVKSAEERARNAEASARGWRGGLVRMLEVLQWVVIAVAALGILTQSFATARESLGFVAGFLVDIWMFTIALMRGAPLPLLGKGTADVDVVGGASAVKEHALSTVVVGAAALLAASALFVHAIGAVIVRLCAPRSASSAASAAPSSFSAPAAPRFKEIPVGQQSAFVLPPRRPEPHLDGDSAVVPRRARRVRLGGTAFDKESAYRRRMARPIARVRDAVTSPIKPGDALALVEKSVPGQSVTRNLLSAVTWLQSASGARWLGAMLPPAPSHTDDIVWNGVRCIALLGFMALLKTA